MRSSLALAVILGALTMEGCATMPTSILAQSGTIVPAGALAIERVQVEPKTLDINSRAALTIRFDLTGPAHILVDLVDEDGRVVRQLKVGSRAAGSHTVRWDGRNSQGQPVSSGVYRYVIRAQQAHETAVVHDPSSETGGEELEMRDFTFDATNNTMRWVMPKAGFARLRIGLEGFPHLRTLLDWVPLEGGAQEIAWDGLDGSGLITLKDHPHLSLKLKAFAMPDNTVIIRGQPSAGAPHIAPDYPPLAKGPTAAFHARHPRQKCHEVRLRLEFPEVTVRDAHGWPVLVGVVPIRVTIDESDASRLVNERFELALFEDLTVIAEEEKGTTPYTYLLETSKLPPGPHLLTVNILSGGDHYGVATQQVLIGAQP